MSQNLQHNFTDSIRLFKFELLSSKIHHIIPYYFDTVSQTVKVYRNPIRLFVSRLHLLIVGGLLTLMLSNLSAPHTMQITSLTDKILGVYFWTCMFFLWIMTCDIDRKKEECALLWNTHLSFEKEYLIRKRNL